MPLNSHHVLISPGVSKKCFTVTIINDRVVEGNETFTLFLSEPTEGLHNGIRINTTMNGTVIRIVDDDCKLVAQC